MAPAGLFRAILLQADLSAACRSPPSPAELRFAPHPPAQFAVTTQCPRLVDQRAACQFVSSVATIVLPVIFGCAAGFSTTNAVRWKFQTVLPVAVT